jgi:two-component system LytT family sensor kinase
MEKVSIKRSIAAAFAGWSALAMITGVQAYVLDRGDANYLPIAHYFVWFGLENYVWVLITPIVFAFSRRYPLTRDHWLARTLQYLLLTTGITLVQPAIVAGVGWLYLPDRHKPFWASIQFMVSKDCLVIPELCFMLYVLAAYQNARREAHYRKLREAELESRVTSAELAMLRMQLHPHFLFNTLQAATVLVHEDPKAAENVLQRLSELLRVALDDMRSLEVPLRQELAFLEHYVEIQKQRFRERLQVSVEADEAALDVNVPSLLLQPLVENAIHHGIGSHKGEDTVRVSAKIRDGVLEIEVKNFASDLNETAVTTGHGVGLRNTRARLEQMYGDAASVVLERMEPRGVCARVHLPVNMAVVKGAA